MFSSRMLSDNEQLDWVQLARSENVGPVTFRRLLERFGSAHAALQALPELARRGGRKAPLLPYARDSAKREIEAARKAGFSLLLPPFPTYPSRLRMVEDAPPLLYAKGILEFLTRPIVAVVGARNASINGKILTRKIVGDLGQMGFAVVSGMARGIDTAVHEGSLPHASLAVLAGGADVIYPSENAALYDNLCRQGVVLSEMPPGTPPQATLFPRRNRIVSGMALGVLVVEASLRSGSLITARLAAEQGREVFAIPGFPLDPRSQGPNSLIRQGATLTENASDISDVLRPIMEHTRLAEDSLPLFDFQPPSPPSASEEENLRAAREKIRKSLNTSPVGVDEIIRQCELSAALVSVVLLELDLAGHIEHHPGNRVSLLAEH